MKKYRLLTFFSMLMLMIPLSSCEDKKKNYIHLSTKEDLLKLKDGGDFILDNDIDCEGLSLKAVYGFKGSINGNNHKIMNVNFISDNQYFGLIGSVAANENVEFKNLGIENFTIDTNRNTASNTLYCGALLASNLQSNQAQDSNVITLENCYAKGNIDVDINVSELYLGGLVGGTNRVLDMINCYSDVDIECDLDDASFSSCKVKAGGLLGYAWQFRGHECEIKNNVFTGSIDVDTVLSVSLKSDIKAGGIVGALDGYHTIEHCLSTPENITVSTFFDKSTYIGGITGYFENWDGNIIYSYYCDYDNKELEENEREQKCSIYKGNKYAYGTGVKLYKTDMLQRDFMKGDYTFTDLEGNTKDSFLNFDENVWNFGYFNEGRFVNPSLKSFG